MGFVKWVIVLALVQLACCRTRNFYNIGHMTNSPKAIDFAVNEGANAIEMDLQFDEKGNPTIFKHAAGCDCSCMCGLGDCHVAFSKSVCLPLSLSTLSRKPCFAQHDAKALLRYAASKTSLALVMIDSKVTDGTMKTDAYTQRRAARNVIKLLTDHLFTQGFKGEVIVGAPKMISLPYIIQIAKTKSPYTKRIHFTIDQENIEDTVTKLYMRSNRNIVYNTGLTACLAHGPATDFQSQLTALNQISGAVGMTYTWSVDKESTMRYYINFFNGIITNYPGRLAKVLKETGVRLATPNDVIPPATSSWLSLSTKDFKCKCSYFPGGCRITEIAPPGTACKCRYVFLWTCRGSVGLCTNPSSHFCQNPDDSLASCKLGAGDCGAYS